MLYCFTHKNHTGTLRSEMDAWQACVLMNDFLPMASVVYDDLPILACKVTNYLRKCYPFSPKKNNKKWVTPIIALF